MSHGKPGVDAPTSIGHQPGEKWDFDDSVTRVFRDMLKRSIPQYEVMRRAVFDLGRSFVQPGTELVDLGCSRGDSLAPFVDVFGGDCRYLGLEVSEPMLTVARERFRREIEAGWVRIERADLRSAYPDMAASLTLSVLTLQFLPPEHRLRILQDIRQRTVPGGALILVEKVLGADAELDALMVDLYHQLKTQHGYSREEVERKRLSLQGVLIPFTARRNDELLRSAGFERVDCFWRWMNFAGWIACA